MNPKHAFLCEDQKLCLNSTKFCSAKHEVELEMANSVKFSASQWL